MLLGYIFCERGPILLFFVWTKVDDEGSGPYCNDVTIVQNGLFAWLQQTIHKKGACTRRAISQEQARKLIRSSGGDESYGAMGRIDAGIYRNDWRINTSSLDIAAYLIGTWLEANGLA